MLGGLGAPCCLPSVLPQATPLPLCPCSHLSFTGPFITRPHFSISLLFFFSAPPLVGLQNGMESLETELGLFLEKTSMTEDTTATSFHGAWTQGKYGTQERLLDPEPESASPYLPYSTSLHKLCILHKPHWEFHKGPTI